MFHAMPLCFEITLLQPSMITTLDALRPPLRQTLPQKITLLFFANTTDTSSRCCRMFCRARRSDASARFFGHFHTPDVTIFDMSLLR